MKTLVSLTRISKELLKENNAFEYISNKEFIEGQIREELAKALKGLKIFESLLKTFPSHLNPHIDYEDEARVDTNQLDLVVTLNILEPKDLKRMYKALRMLCEVKPSKNNKRLKNQLKNAVERFEMKQVKQ